MKILILGPLKRNQPIAEHFNEQGISHDIFCDLDEVEFDSFSSYTHLISSGYHKRIPESVLSLFESTKRLNIHASYLPFGKGIGTILFALLYPVVLGSSIHILEPDIDMGRVLVQQEFVLPDFVKTQRQLHSYWVQHATDLFLRHLDALLCASFEPMPPMDEFVAPYLSRDQSETHLSLLNKGWDTSISDIRIISLALALRSSYTNAGLDDV